MNWSYLFKHWFSTILLGPVVSQIMMFVDILNPNKVVGLVEAYPISLIFGFIFSTPTYILYGLLYYCLVKLEVRYTKAILISFSVMGVLVTTQLIKGSMMSDIAISYSIAAILTGLFFKLNIDIQNK